MSTGSDSDRVSVYAELRVCQGRHPVAIAPGTDLMAKQQTEMKWNH